MEYILEISNFSILLLTAFVDLKTLKIPNILIVIFIVLNVGFDIYVNNKILEKIGISLLFFLIFFCVYFITNGIGMGDIKLISALSYYSGFRGTVTICLIACSVGILFFLVEKQFIGSARSKIPFVPFITLGTIINTVILEKILWNVS